jgi:hypothetical protein
MGRASGDMDSGARAMRLRQGADPEEGQAMMPLAKDEHIVAAWAEHCKGPGWENDVVWVCIRDGFTNRHRVDALQPEEHSDSMKVLFSVSALVSAQMRSHVIAVTTRAKR